MPLPFFGSLMVSELSSADLNWNRLEKITNLSFSDDQRTALLKRLNDYVTECARQAIQPTEKDVRRRVTAIEEHARALASLMSDDPAGQTAIAHVFHLGLPDPGLLRHTLFDLALSARVILQDLPAR